MTTSVAECSNHFFSKSYLFYLEEISVDRHPLMIFLYSFDIRTEQWYNSVGKKAKEENDDKQFYTCYSPAKMALYHKNNEHRNFMHLRHYHILNRVIEKRHKIPIITF